MKKFLLLTSLVLMSAAFFVACAQCPKARHAVDVGFLSTHSMPVSVSAGFSIVPQESIVGFSVGLHAGPHLTYENKEALREGFLMGANTSVLVKVFRRPGVSVHNLMIGGTLDEHSPGAYIGTHNVIYLGEQRTKALFWVLGYDIIQQFPTARLGLYL